MPGVNRATMAGWVEEAIRELGGSGALLDVCKTVWRNHGDEIQAAGDMFYKWQYEVRWSADILRKEGVLKSADQSKRGIWQLA